MTATHTRPATAADLPLIAALIHELAAYEKLADKVCFDEAELGRNLFGERPAAEALVGELDGVPAGMAIFFPTFSTFDGKPGMWLEDLFVRPAARGHGLGKALIGAVAQIASARGCTRLDWSVLDWNEPSIRFYETLGAQMQDSWRIMRVAGPALGRFGQSE